MTCLSDGTLTICYSDVICGRRVLYCPICECRRRMVVRSFGAWYSPTLTCLGCGDSWCEGELGERPFRRGWREQAKVKARSDWRAALPAVAFKRAVLAELESVV